MFQIGRGMLVMNVRNDELCTLVDISENWEIVLVLDQSGKFKKVGISDIVSVDKPKPDKKPEIKKSKKQIRDFVEGKKFS